MKKLPVIQDVTAKQELHSRIALSNRPRLNITQKRLDEVSAALATSNRDRTQFAQDPTAYLRAQSLPVSSCSLVEPGNNAAPQTSEVATVTAAICCTSVTTATACIAFGCSIVSTVTISIHGWTGRNFEFYVENSNPEWKRGSQVL
ncbi:MAG TPA: hypothetical protein VJT82_01430 [Pyrinomonadaceae bacterium]|nr:hypothetical protein [Pyrinomonadaceae bacterium]